MGRRIRVEILAALHDLESASAAELARVDEEGRAEIADEQLRSWQRIREVEHKSAARCAASGEEPFSVMVSSLSFHRSRTALRPPSAPDHM